jgi:hypothetical protein
MISRYGGKVDSRYQLGKSVALPACDLLIPLPAGSLMG